MSCIIWKRENGKTLCVSERDELPKIGETTLISFFGSRAMVTIIEIEKSSNFDETFTIYVK